MPSRKSSVPPTSPTPSSSSSSSKLPRFLQKPNGRDRTKSISVADPSPTTSLSSNGFTPQPISVSAPTESRSDFLPRKSSHKSHNSTNSGNVNNGNSSPASSSLSSKRFPEANTPSDDTPVIVEPPPLPRPRTNSERPVGPYTPSASTSRIGDLPTRLSGWFSHTFSSSSTDLTLPNVLAHPSTPTKTKGSAILNAAKHGKGHIDKAMRFLLDSDATPDKCTDPIWILGLQHPGYEPPPPPPAIVHVEERASSPNSTRRRSGDSSSKRRGSGSLRSSTSSASSHESQTTVTKPNLWPPVFYSDFTTRIWLTYRNQFEPIRDQRLADLPVCGMPAPEIVQSSPPTKKWPWGGEKGWTSDAGWGCMLRTGQSLLANALLHTHLGRDWRVPPNPVRTADFAKYVQIITWFLDSVSPDAPFSVHRMALAGKELGTDVGHWFGPSIAAGAIKQLVHNYGDAGIGVSVGTDSVIFETDVYSASHSYGPPGRKRYSSWGDKGVLILLGIRLGLSGVNAIYYETIKVLFTWPQSVGIAGGRPSSSYYFVGSQADNLFYLDPHHARPAIPLRPISEPTPTQRHYHHHHQQEPIPVRHRSPVSPSSSIRTGSSTFSFHAPTSPSPLQNQYSTSSSSSSGASSSMSPNNPRGDYRHHHQQSASTITTVTVSSRPQSPEVGGAEEGDDLDATQLHFVTAYSPAELKTFHCDRVRKMPLSGLDPSMLVGFLCKNEDEWIDLRARIADLNKNPKLKPIFSVQDEPPNWPSDMEDDIALESIDMDLDDDEDLLGDGDDDEDEDEDEEEDEAFFDARNHVAGASVGSASASGSSSSAGHSRASRNGSFRDKKPPPVSVDVMDSDEDGGGGLGDEDDDDDFVDTPGPNTRFEFPSIEEKVPPGEKAKGKRS